MKINEQRLKERMDIINGIAVSEDDGMMRLALTDADRQARDLLKQWMLELGMEVRIDDMGSMYGYLPGTDPDALPVCSGSHMDTQPNGGKYDGFFGVMAALEAVCSIKDAGIQTKSPLVVVNWTNEEGARFKPPMIASGVVAGNFTKEFAYGIEDIDGVKLGDALATIGYVGEESNRLTKAKAMVEAHIEQGPVLEAENLEFGVVNAVLGITGLNVTVIGEADHAGPSPMKMRKDSLMTASEIMLAVEEYITNYGDPIVATMGVISVEPASSNIIPGVTKFTIDMRHYTNEGLTEIEDEIIKIINRLAEKRGCKCEIGRYWRADPVYFDEKVVDAVERAAKNHGVTYRRMTSGAGHDSVFISSIIPTGMMFIPSIGGKSHCPQEHSRFEDIVTGTEILADVLLDLDKA